MTDMVSLGNLQLKHFSVEQLGENTEKCAEEQLLWAQSCVSGYSVVVNAILAH